MPTIVNANSAAAGNSATQQQQQQSNAIPQSGSNQILTTTKPVSRKGGIIFPSIKNKPSVVNSTFATDSISFKDVKVRIFNDYFL